MGAKVSVAKSLGVYILLYIEGTETNHEGKKNGGCGKISKKYLHEYTSIKKFIYISGNHFPNTYKISYFFRNDPSAGSPTETLLRLLLPLNVKVYPTSSLTAEELPLPEPQVRRVHRNIQSVGATGGVYKGQGRNQCKLMTCAY